nr:MAG TPA: hypothetical protein [Caudoviricetes sp.]
MYKIYLWRRAMEYKTQVINGTTYAYIDIAF